MTTIRDQSSWIEIEKQKNLSNLKTIAFASAAHELRNPLNAINFSLQVLQGFKQEQDAKDYMKTALNSSKLMLSLINDILDFSQLESNSLILNISEVYIAEILKDCAAILELKANMKGIKLIATLSENFPDIIYTDPNRLQQIIINLLSNAVKYTQKGFVKVSGTYHQNENLIHIEVLDSGVGMDDQQISKLFQAFTKIQSNRHLNKEGVGLGLTISKNLSKALGGDITVKSQINIGSSFTLKLPMNKMMMNHQCIEFKSTQCQSNLQVRNAQLSQSVDLGTIVTSQNNSINLDKNLRKLHENFDYYITAEERQLGLSNQDITVEFVDEENQLKLASKQCRKKFSLQLEEERQIYVNSIFKQTGSQLTNFNRYSELKINDYDSNREFQLGSRSQCQCPRILLVDDDPFNIFALQGLLNHLQIQSFDKCFNGEQAIEKVKQLFNMRCEDHHQLKLILIDNQIPSMQLQKE
ncbi:multi-sensor hybrid histidine kinase [Stylonychia lemnae]|uniref:Multi-sensor hybrid histidine kinase n=1 Tax=Stylonychia lemnae TaxID=5949 RepID=A0A078B5C6_STYLE|nr:multi-sensor hybrid histidine kinase [Stylonychia lemnae]|eukprot:CDW89730.1 multi-sensor hybrid histidine kinase [Stylonychia lemnae]